MYTIYLAAAHRWQHLFNSRTSSQKEAAPSKVGAASNKFLSLYLSNQKPVEAPCLYMHLPSSNGGNKSVAKQ
jgi:hypothetical protein